MKYLRLLWSAFLLLALCSVAAAAITDGGAQHKIFGPYMSDADTAYLGIKVKSYVSDGGTTGKNAWTDEAKSSAATTFTDSDNDGVVELYCDGAYDFLVTTSADVTIKRHNNVKCTSDSATMWEGNNGTGNVTAATANKYQFYLKRSAGHIPDALQMVTGADGAEVVTTVVDFDSSGTAVEKLGWHNVKYDASGGAGTSGDPWTGWEATVNALAANTVVYFPAGTYLSTTAIVAKAGWRIIGDGVATHIKTATADMNIIEVTSVDDVEISRMKLESTAGGTSGDNCGVDVNGASNVHVDLLEVIGVGYVGVHFDNGTTLSSVTRCYFHDFDLVTFKSGHGDIRVYDDSHDNYIAGNHCFSGADIGIASIGYAGNPVRRTIIDGNTVGQMKGYGIVSYNNSADSVQDGATITNNTIKDTQGTYLSGTSGAGIYTASSAALIKGNTIVNANAATTTESLAPAAIGINAPTGPTVIADNTISVANWYGIMVVGATAAGFTSITGNTVQEGVKTAIYLKAAGFVNCTGNTVYNISNATNGIYCSGGNSINVTGNYLYGHTTNGMTNGIRIAACTNAVVTGNMINQTATYGILVESAANYCTVAGNQAYGETAGFFLSASTYCRATGNTFRSGGTNAVATTGTCTGSILESNDLTPAAVSSNAATGAIIVMYGAAAPGSGTWAVGDTVWDTTPVTAEQIGWRCTVAGTPGTWVAMPVMQ